MMNKAAKVKGWKDQISHFPLSREFILCWDNETSLPLPLPQVSDLLRPGQDTHRRAGLQPPLLCCRPTDNDDVTIEMLLGDRVSDESGWAELGQSVTGRTLSCASDDTSCITQGSLYTRVNVLRFSCLCRDNGAGCGLVFLLPLQFKNNRAPGRGTGLLHLEIRVFPDKTCFYNNYIWVPAFRWRGGASGDWWAQLASNELVSYFTMQPLKRLVKHTSACAIGWVFGGQTTGTCSFDGSAAIHPDLGFCVRGSECPLVAALV